MTVFAPPVRSAAARHRAPGHAARTWAVAGLFAVAALCELAAGRAFDSKALLAEAAHGAAHVAAFGLAAAAYLARDALARDGRARAARAAPELAALLNGLTLLAVGAELAAESLTALLHPPSARGHGAALPVAGLGLILNVAAGMVLHHDPRREAAHDADLNFRAVYLHVLGDGGAALLAALGLIAADRLGWRWADAAAGLAGALWVLLLGLRVVSGAAGRLRNT